MDKESIKAMVREAMQEIREEESRVDIDPALLEGKRILHMGCGDTRMEGALNVDYVETKATDLVFNLERTPWTWAPDEHFEKIEAVDIIEHFVHVIPVINEMYRVLQPGGTIHIHTTHWQTVNSFTDPSHFHYFTEHSFDYWDPTTFMGSKYGWYRSQSGVMKVMHSNRDGQELDVLLFKPRENQ